MKHFALCLSLALSALTLAPAAAHAQSRADARAVRQQVRIQQGAASGQLTRGEYRRLERGEFRVNTMERRAAADGVVTGREAARINRAQNRQSARIWVARHNLRTAR